MATWYVRPNTSHNATRDGTSYATAWGGWSAITWGVGGVTAGDTLYVCGAHNAGANILATGPHLATVNSRTTIRGDYAPDPGSISFAAGTYYFNVNKNYTTVRNLTINAGDYACIVIGGVALTGVQLLSNCFCASGTATGSLVRFQSFDTWTYIDTVIDDNDFVGGSGSVGGGGIQWWATSASAVTNLTRLTISNNRFSRVSATRATITLKCSTGVPDTTQMTDITVSGNTFRNCGSVTMEIYGTDVYAHNAGVKIFSNEMYDQVPVGGLGGGIVVGGFGTSTTAGFGHNLLYSNTGVNLDGISGFINAFYGTYLIYDNDVDNVVVTTGSLDGNGILLDHGCDKCVVFRNHIKNIHGTGATDYTSGFGILVLDATNSTVFGNIVDGCVIGVGYGGKVSGQSSTIRNNHFLNCTLAGISLNPSADNANNKFYNNLFTATNAAAPSINSLPGSVTETNNCFYGFGTPTQSLHASSITTNPDLSSSYRPQAEALRATGTYLGGADFYGREFSGVTDIGAVAMMGAGRTTSSRTAARRRGA